jgi:hypothetical protein
LALPLLFELTIRISCYPSQAAKGYPLSQELSAAQAAPVEADGPLAVTSPGASLSAFAETPWPALVLLLYFGLRLLFFAIGIAPQVPPDEVTHFGKSQIFSHFFLLPVNSADSYQYGLVTNIPWLYYWIMGKLLVLDFIGIPELIFLRLCNIPLIFGTVYFAWRMLLLLTKDRLTGLLLLVVMTNTLMLSFLSASVSYDNLTNLLAAMALYYLFAFFKERSGDALALSLLCQLAGCLTKNTFLPLFLILTLVLLLHELRQLPLWPGTLAGFLRSSGRRRMLLVTGILVSVLLNLQLYGGNFLHYKTLEPESFQVLPLEQALQYRLAARTYIFNQFREGRIGLEQAKQMASLVNHEGDRKDTVSLVENYAELQKSGEPLLGLLPYSAIWMLHMLESTYGIKAHLGMSNHGPGFIPLALFLLAALGAFLCRWRPSELQWLPSCYALVALSYAAFLMYLVNFSTYQIYKDIVLSVAGRYLFPVIGPIYVLACYYLMRSSNGGKKRLVILVASSLTFIAADFPFFLANSSASWFR